MNMLTIDPKDTPQKDLHQFILGTVAPRPIAFVSTIDEEGNKNLAPYSFFNAFSSNPPIVVFSSNRRGSDNTTKDTLRNVRVSGECVINAVNYSMVRQMAVASVDFPTGVSEFEKTGLTPIPSDLVKAFRVAESPAHMECKVKDIITLGEGGGAGHLIICEVVRMHIAHEVLTDRKRIDPDKMDLMGRMGRA
ncbi:MAG TPA: flavin reductase family protein, partial [Saprospiraceae bacterium]|nr:flavin reductase family protein [Saprospiraceae bacterium]